MRLKFTEKGPANVWLKMDIHSVKLISLIISTGVSHMMLLKFGMICHWKFELLLHYQV